MVRAWLSAPTGRRWDGQSTGELRRQWSNWTAKLEYLYVDFGTVNDTLIGIAPITPIVTSSHVTDQIVRVGLNYRKFGDSALN